MSLYCRFLPESPRWLLLKKRYKQAHKVVHKMARVNGRDLSHLNIADITVEVHESLPLFIPLKGISANVYFI